jgi:methyltransferase-like protein/SAM-dependent methyltransferase
VACVGAVCAGDRFASFWDVGSMAHVPPASSSTASDRARTAYDDVPYISRPYWDSRPARLATIGRLFGMQPAPPDNCRVLELGCASGGNLIPLADQFPGSQFLGLDVSPVQIDAGRRVIDALGLSNVRLEAADLCQVDARYGQFDYIVAHGVLSWVPREVQDRVLAICSGNLAPQGVAFVSYNTFPGWLAKMTVRDLMVYRARRFDNPLERSRQARALLESIVDRGLCADERLRGTLANELAAVRAQPDAYLLHELLEDSNQPLYFHQFMARAGAVGLQYLGESSLRLMAPNVASREVCELLSSVAGNLEEMEQYIDFLHNRTFRATLLCHRSIALDHNLKPAMLGEMHISSWAQSETPRALAVSGELVKFSTQGGQFESADPLVKSALFHLIEAWPRAVPFRQLLASARAAVGRSPADDGQAADADATELAGALLRCYCAEVIDVNVHALAIVANASERPVATRLARYQAQHGTVATNLWHSAVALNEFERLLLPRMDGSRDRAALLEVLLELAASGAIKVYDGQQPAATPERRKELLHGSVMQAIGALARKALLLA